MRKGKFYENSYLFLALGIVVVVFGFSNSYFSRLNEMSFPYHLHGISASLWMMMLVTQPYLYKIGKIRLHRLLGWISLILVPLIVIGGVIMMKFMIHGQQNYPPNTVYQLAFIDVCTLLGFVVVYSLGIYFRKNIRLHARFLACTIFGPLIPALTRVFFVMHLADNFNASLTYSYVLIELVLLFIIWRERKMKEVKYSYVPFLVFIVVQHLLMYFSSQWNWWISTMNYLTGFS